MLTVLTGECAISRSVYSRKALSASSWVAAIVMVADSPSGPCIRAPTSPDPGEAFQPGGTATVTSGASASDTVAVTMAAGLAGGAQVTASTGAGTWVVGRIPGGRWSLSVLGVPMLERALVAVIDAATGNPSLVRTHAADATAVTTAVATVVVRQSFISP